MGKKGGKFKRKENSGPVKTKAVRVGSDDEDMMNDEIDAFHKNRDIIPLNINEDMEESDEDNEHPVFDFEDDEDKDEDAEDEDIDDDDDDDDDDDKPQKGLAAKIMRTQKYLQATFGGVEDDILDDADEDEQEKSVWVKKKDMYGGDDYEPQSSDDENAAKEEEEVLKLQSDKAKVLSMEDFGIETEPTFEEILEHGKPILKDSLDKGIKSEGGMTYEIIKKDINALTEEEQMDAVESSAPELVNLLSELNDALEQLENKVSPLVEKIKAQENSKKVGMHYLEVKQLLLQSYCQAITFYLLLKSEGQPVRDHPVISRLVEIKGLLIKIKEIDDNLPFDVEDIVDKDVNNITVMKIVEEVAAVESDSLTNSQIVSAVPSEKRAIMVESQKAADLNTVRSSKNKESQHKHQDKQVGKQSMEMLKSRESLEEKWKQKGLFSSVKPKSSRNTEHVQPVNRQLETSDDFIDEALEINGVTNGKSSGDRSLSYSSKQRALNPNKRKVISGDDDFPKWDDIGERRRKHELRVLAGAGVKSADDDDKEDEAGNISSEGDDHDNGESGTDSDLELYNAVGRQHAAKRAAKSDMYTRTAEVSSFPDTVVDGKRNITRQIEKNRGLTRARKKLIKNPRKKYKLKHKKAEVSRRGQVVAIRKISGPYGGEASGINPAISRSVRFKS